MYFAENKHHAEDKILPSGCIQVDDSVQRVRLLLIRIPTTYFSLSSGLS